LLDGRTVLDGVVVQDDEMNVTIHGDVGRIYTVGEPGAMMDACGTAPSGLP